MGARLRAKGAPEVQGENLMNKHWMQIGRLAVLSGVLAALAYGQAITGALTVNVTDSTGGVIVGANLELLQEGTNTSFKGQTDSSGNHLFPQLSPGQYSLNVSAPGFQSKTIEGIQLVIGQRARVNAVLEVGQLAESVTVSATAETLLNAESAAAGQVIDEKPIVELPLNGRNFVQLAQLASGAAPLGIGVSPATTWTGREDSTLSVAGGRESNNSFLVNGIETRNARFGSAGVRPSAEAIQEFRVQRSTFGAEFGRSSAIINTSIKQGTNEIHGSLYEFFRNKELDANDFFANRSGQERPPFNQNNFGVAVGGPVVQNKTFWFFNYEGFRQREGVTRTGLYPSRAQLSGDLADDSAGTGFLPASSLACQQNPGPKCVDLVDPFSGDPFPNNRIPESRLDPITQEAIPFIVVPNVSVEGGRTRFPSFNSVGAPSVSNDWDQFNTRVDHQFTSNDLVHFVFNDTDERLDVPVLAPLGGDGFPQENRLFAGTYTKIISPTILNEFRVGYNRSSTFRLAETSNGDTDFAREVFGLQNTSTNPFNFGVPQFPVSGFSQIGSLSEAIGAEDQKLQFVDNLSINLPKHTLRMGTQIIRQDFDQVTDFAGNPTFNFQGRFTGAPGLGLGDFLLGVPFTATAALGDSSQELSTTFYSGYIQDDWQVHQKLTVNMGVRYEFAKSPVEENDRSLVFANDIGEVVTVGNGVRRSIVDPDYNNFAPRIGIAYRPLEKTVVRAGFGIYYATDNYNEEQFKVIGPPFFQSQTITSNPNRPTLFMENMLPPLEASPNVSPFSFDRSNDTPYTSQWTFGIQQGFGRDYVLEVEYTGSTGQKLPQRRNLNIASIDPTGTVPIEARRQFPNLAFVLLTYNGGWSSYQALTTKLEKRFSQGSYVLASYTWQNSIDLGATDEFSAISADFKTFDKGPSTFHVPHRFVVSYIYELPFGRGKKFGSNMSGALNKLLGGWQITGISTFSEGQFGTPGLGVDNLVIGAFSQSRPDIVGDPKAGRSLPDAWFNPEAFDFPRDEQGNRLFIPGNAGRNTLQQPGVVNFDLGVFKNTSITERFDLQFRWELFNAFNHTQFGPANLSTTNPSFGAITSTLVNARRMQFGLKLLF